jgi:hypothetical protein
MAEPLKLPRLNINVPIAEVRNGKIYPTAAFVRWWQLNAEAIEARLTAVELAIIEDALDTIAAAVVVVEAGVIAVADGVADAQAAADTAQSTIDDAATAQALADSFTDAAIVGDASTAEASITAHTRYYADGSSVAVNSGTITGLTLGAYYYIYYDQASRLGGAVTYVATTVAGDAQPSTANPNRHSVGSVLMPALISDPPLPGFPTYPPQFVPEEVIRM